MESRRRRTRRFPFKGTIRAYAEYLENRILQLEQQLSQQVPAEKSAPATGVEQTIASLDFVIVANNEIPKSVPALSYKNPPSVGHLYRNIDYFVKQLPYSDSQWLEERKRLDLTTPEESAITFGVLTRLTNPVKPARQWSTPKPRFNPLEILDDYCTFARTLQQSAQQETQQSRFAAVLFLCICCVSLKAGVTIDNIDERIRIYFRKPSQTPGYCSRLRRAAKWVAQLMERLELSLRHRGPELFVLCPSSPANKLDSC